MTQQSNIRRLYLLIYIVFFVCSLLSPSPASAQSLSPEYKDPSRARLFSIFIPGSGHLYAGESGKGAALLIGSGVALVGGVVLSDFEQDYDFTCASGNCIDPDAYAPNYTPLFIGAGIAGALWLYSLLDSSPAAHRANARNGISSRFTVSPGPLLADGSLKPAISLQFSF